MGKKARKEPVSQRLFDDLKDWRHELFRHLRAYNKRYLTERIDSELQYALRHGARRVRAVGCREGECAWRIGLELAAERFAGTREPHLRPNVVYAKQGDAYEFSLR